MKALDLVGIKDIQKLYGPGEGRHWFDEDTMAFFKTQLSSHGYKAADGSIYFVSSEKGPHTPRLYSVRKLSTTREITTVGEFQEHKTSARAQAAAMKASHE